MLARLGLCVVILTPSLAVVAVHATDLPALVQKAKPAVVEILTSDQQNNVLKTGTPRAASLALDLYGVGEVFAEVSRSRIR
jgi:hypothetical protein